MTSKKRMLTAMCNAIPDRVPVAPDMSNMIPCKRTGLPFWDIYLFEKVPLWKAYIDAVRHFGFDGWLAGLGSGIWPEDAGSEWREAIVKQTPERIYTRRFRENGKREWTHECTVYYRDNPPSDQIALDKVGLSNDDPQSWIEVERSARSVADLLPEVRSSMGESGIVGLDVWLPGLDIKHPEQVFEYYDDRDTFLKKCAADHKRIMRRLAYALSLKPDFILIGISGHMISNPPEIFRELSLPTLKAITRACKDADIPSQIHCCGPEKELVTIAAEESDLSSINPLEIPPMGNCTLADVKKNWGAKVSLMGNLHTTDVMLHGSRDEVFTASRKAMDDAAAGGGFILSTGDQCGRDTPDENIFAMIEAVEQFGKY